MVHLHSDTIRHKNVSLYKIFFNLIILLECISNEHVVYTMITKTVYTINHSHKHWSTSKC